MASRFSLPALLIATLALTACPPKYPKCENDEHCKEQNEVCVNGQCQECGRDTDCKEGFRCSPQNKCVPKPECAADTDCRPGAKCVNERCDSSCKEDGDCRSGFKCQAGQCAAPPECLSDADCAEGQKCSGGKCSAPAAAQDTGCTLETLYFDFNDFSLSASARATLDKNADCLKTRKGPVTIAGHADERGTEEYNLHLGERRANSVKKYLGALGIDAARLKTVSFGEERPADPGHDEAAWSKNRRVELSCD